MLRKWMTVLLSLFLALMLPLCAVAETQHTLTIVPGDLLAGETAVKDLLDVLSLTVTPGQKSGALTLTLGETDVATIALGADVTGLYAHSNLLSDDVLYVTWDDAFEFLKETMRSEMIGENVNSLGIDAIMDQFDEAKEQIVAALGGGMMLDVQTMTEEEEFEQIREMFADDPEMLTYIENVRENMTLEDGSFSSEEHDTADQKYSMKLTEEDILPLLDTEYMRSAIWEALEREDPDLGGDNYAEMTQEALDEARTVLESSDIAITMDVYTVDAGETLVALDMIMDMTVTDEGVSENAKMLIAYDRLTNADGVNYTAEVRMDAADENLMQIAFDFTRGNDAVSEGLLGFLVEGEELLVTYRAENPQADVRERDVALYLRSNAVNIIEPAASDRPLITFQVVSSPADPAVLSAIEAADADSSVNVFKLSDEGMQALVGDITNRAMQAAYTALANLPASVVQLLFSE